MAGAYDRLREGRPTDADREWLSWLYGEYLDRIAPITPEQEGECNHYFAQDGICIYCHAPQAASGGGDDDEPHPGGPGFWPSPAPADLDGLIERLRRRRGILGALEGDLDMMEEAADALDGMRREKDRLFLEWQLEHERADHNAEVAVAAEKQSAELRECLKECAEDLGAELDHRYCIVEGRTHPSQQGRYDRDMFPVYRARSLLTKGSGE